MFREHIHSFLEKDFSLQIEGNPDVLHLEYESFSIDDARYLKERQQHKSLVGEKKFFIIAFDFITHEAQNSLLKIVEEPTEGTHFFFITSSEKIFLPTLLSRVQVERLDDSVDNDEVTRAFIVSSLQERLEFLKESIESKNKVEARSVVEDLLSFIHKEGLEEKEHAFFSSLLQLHSYLNDRGSSVKMIMEYVALMTPRSMV